MFHHQQLCDHEVTQVNDLCDGIIEASLLYSTLKGFKLYNVP